MHTRTHERTSSADGRCAGGGHGLLISNRVYSTVYLCTRAHWATHNMCDTNANILQIPCAPVANYRLLHVKRRAQLLHVALPHRIMMMDKEVARSNTRTKTQKSQSQSQTRQRVILITNCTARMGSLLHLMCITPYDVPANQGSSVHTHTGNEYRPTKPANSKHKKTKRSALRCALNRAELCRV